MNIIGQVVERAERPAYVTFERVPVEDRQASLAAGHYVAKDIDYVHVTPPYSKDVFKQKAATWLAQLKTDVANQRIPQTWADQYEASYKAWKNGQELPVTGTPIKGWGVISPAQQETLIRQNIRTVEDLAGMTDEAIRRIGMGAIELKHKAGAWLAQLQDKGPLTVKMAALETENANLRGDLNRAVQAIEQLKAQIGAVVAQPGAASSEIAAADIIDAAPEPDVPDLARQYETKFGKPPHHRMKQETIAAALQG